METHSRTDIPTDIPDKPVRFRLQENEKRSGGIGRYVLKPLFWLMSLVITGLVIGAIAILVMFNMYSKDLPDSSSLTKYQPKGMTRLYAGNGELMAEYAKERRVFVPFDDIPTKLIQAFIAAEDQNFYSHRGVDPEGILRAFVKNMQNYGSQEHSLVGGSTITQQVVKNFLLTSEKSYERKIREAILALRITQNYSKNRILELYLNEIYLGMGAYGVSAAALEYFGKELDELTTEEAALLAAMPKAPSYYDPRKRPEIAFKRRNYVLRRMVEDGYINEAEFERASAEPLQITEKRYQPVAQAPFFAEEVRRWLLKNYGTSQVYEGSLFVKTTVDVAAQQILDKAFRDALMVYDRRHGYRGPVTSLKNEPEEAWPNALQTLERETPLYGEQRLAIVRELKDREAVIVLRDIVEQEEERNKQAVIDEESSSTAVWTEATIPLAELTWARPAQPSGALGATPRKPSDILRIGDVVLVTPVADKKGQWSLQQIPKISGAMVAMRPQTGEVLALTGGYSFKNSEFNRATQAMRQPGSSFKPFIYLAALERGFSPSSIIMDAPIELPQGPGLPMWRPKNYGGDFLGPTTLRTGLEKSRNVMTVRLAQMIGVKAVTNVGERFGIYNKLVPNYSNVLGAQETTVLRMVTAYSMLVNGGLKVEPVMVKRIDDAKGKTIYRADNRLCEGCNDEQGNLDGAIRPPELVSNRERVADPRIAYQMVALLKGVVERGTATSAKSLGFEVAGKTGTTNDSRDAWFVGFTQDIVVGLYVGFDQPKDMGDKETGGRVALPAFISYMKDYYKDMTPTPFEKPSGIIEIAVDRYTGIPPLPWQPAGSTIMETFITGGSIYIPGQDIEYAEPSDAQKEQEGITPNNATDTPPAYGMDAYGQPQGEGAYIPPGTIPPGYQPSADAVTGNGTSPATNEGYTAIPQPGSPSSIQIPGGYQRQVIPGNQPAQTTLPPNHPSRVQERRQRAYELRQRVQQQPGAGQGTGGLY